MLTLITELKSRFPALKFTPGRQFYWSPASGEIFYKASAKGKKAAWSLLHETGHALLGHHSYQADIELLKLEVAAWQKAQALASELKMKIDPEHIQDCLDTYRDWLYRRSICPDCSARCLQQEDCIHYRCYNCHKVWKVGDNRFARPYRRSEAVSSAIVFE
jgi:hypothetical protein